MLLMKGCHMLMRMMMMAIMVTLTLRHHCIRLIARQGINPPSSHPSKIASCTCYKYSRILLFDLHTVYNRPSIFGSFALLGLTCTAIQHELFGAHDTAVTYDVIFPQNDAACFRFPDGTIQYSDASSSSASIWSTPSHSWPKGQSVRVPSAATSR